MTHATAATFVYTERQCAKLADLIEDNTDRLKRWQRRKLARLASATGMIWASRTWLADKLKLSRATLTRVLADLDDKAFFVVGVPGKYGGTVLVPKLRAGDDREATIRLALRRAEIGCGEAVELGAATVRCCRKLPGKTLQLLQSALRKRAQVRALELENPDLSLESSLTPTAMGEAASATPAEPGDDVHTEGTRKDLQEGAGIDRDDPPSGPGRLLVGAYEGAGVGLGDRLAGLWHGLTRPSTAPGTVEAQRKLRDADELRASVRRLMALERGGPTDG